MHKSRLNPSLRPLSARALKSTLDTLRPYLMNSTVLDLFAGQGRFGIGATQEGAKKVIFIERDSRTAKDLDKVIRHPSLPQGTAQIVTLDVWEFLRITNDSFEIVFADPPFEFWNTEFQITLLTRVVKVLRTGSIFLVKHPKAVLLSSPSEELQLWKSSVFGESRLTYFRYGEKG